MLREFVYPSGYYVEEEGENYVRISIPVVERSYGITLGNALRRVLLSSIKGYAVVALRIDGITHEFTSMDGVLEDVPIIVINFKRIVLKVDEDAIKLPHTLNVEFVGPKEVKAGDIETPAGIEIINKQQHLFTITAENRKVSMSITIDGGFGYLPAEDIPESYKEDFPVGTIFLDADFSPVKRANFWTEEVIHLNKEKLYIEIETNGALEPLKAYEEALNILEKNLEALHRRLKFVGKEEEVIDIEEFEKRIERYTKMPVSDLELPSEVVKLLEERGISTVGELIEHPEEEIVDWFKEADVELEHFETLKQKVYALNLKFSKEIKGGKK